MAYKWYMELYEKILGKPCCAVNGTAQVGLYRDGRREKLIRLTVK
jgi:hypothetical protein